MSRTTRIIIFYAFLFIFLISAPILLLSTAGYHLNLKRGRIEQIGALLLKSSPSGASILVNGRKIKQTTPSLINLSPDEYKIEIQKDGYYPWIKTLYLASRETTFAEDIILWKIAEPKNISGHDYRFSKISPNARFTIFLRDTPETGELWLNDALLGNETALAVVSSEAEIDFSPSSALILVSEARVGNNKFTVINLESSDKTEIGIPSSLLISSLVWGETDSTLYGYGQGTIYAINLFTNRVDPIARGGMSFTLIGTNVWSIQKEANGQGILALSRAGNTQTKPLPINNLGAGQYEFLQISGQYLVIHEKTNDQIFIIDPKNPRQIVLKLPGSHIKSRQNRDGDLELLTWNSYELWRGNAKTRIVELLRRQSDQLYSAEWHPRGEYVFFSSFSGIQALELDNRDQRNMTRLSSKNTANLAIDTRGNRLFFTTKDDYNSGLFELDLQ